MRCFFLPSSSPCCCADRGGARRGVFAGHRRAGEIEFRRSAGQASRAGDQSFGRRFAGTLGHRRAFSRAGAFKLLKLFGPEHGIDGQVGAGKDVQQRPRSRIRACRSTRFFKPPQGDYRHPTPEMFAGLDAVVYDVQDLGNRSYTFISTLGNVMDEAAKSGIEVIVLDRPNPLGGVRIEGPRLDPSLKSFVGMYNIPLVYGLTPGELAQWINARTSRRPCKLKVVAMKGWTRGMVWEDTHLRWVPTSPNIPTIRRGARLYRHGHARRDGHRERHRRSRTLPDGFGHGLGHRLLARRFNALRIPGVFAVPQSYRADGGNGSGSLLRGRLLADRSAQRGQPRRQFPTRRSRCCRQSCAASSRSRATERGSQQADVRQMHRDVERAAGNCRRACRSVDRPVVEFRSGALGGGTVAVPALRVHAVEQQDGQR